jgi:hypothetical protein
MPPRNVDRTLRLMWVWRHLARRIAVGRTCVSATATSDRIGGNNPNHDHNARAVAER